ncbi:MAG: autotransporter outer membrane beta-barrel domain-containing protein, partial [Candidimonas sp.]
GGAQGVYEPDVDFRQGGAGLMSVEGQVVLDGVIRPRGRHPLPRRLIPIIRTQGQGHGIRMEETLRVDSPLIYTYTLNRSGDAELDVGVTADFTKLTGLSEEQAGLAANIQSKWDNAPEELLQDYAEVFDHFTNVRTADEYRRALTEVANDTQQASASVLPGKNRSFVQLMMSCPESRADDALLYEGSCYWMRVVSNDSRLEQSDQNQGFHGTGITYQIGGQKELAPGLVLGGSFAYENFRSRAVGASVQTDGGLFSGGVALKRQRGPWLFAGVLTAGRGTYDTRRALAVSGTDRIAESRWRSRHMGMRLRASYTHAQPDWYIKPLFDVDLVYQRVPGYSETGAGAFDLDFQDASRWTATLTPTLEVGGRVFLKGGVLRPYFSVGASWMSDSSWVVDAHLQGDPLRESFRLRTSLPKAMGEVKAGVELVSGGGYEVKAEYDLRFAKGYVSRTGMLRMAVRF